MSSRSPKTLEWKAPRPPAPPGPLGARACTPGARTPPRGLQTRLEHGSLFVLPVKAAAPSLLLGVHITFEDNTRTLCEDMIIWLAHRLYRILQQRGSQILLVPPLSWHVDR